MTELWAYQKPWGGPGNWHIVGTVGPKQHDQRWLDDWRALYRRKRVCTAVVRRPDANSTS